MLADCCSGLVSRNGIWASSRALYIHVMPLGPRSSPLRTPSPPLGQRTLSSRCPALPIRPTPPREQLLSAVDPHARDGHRKGRSGIRWPPHGPGAVWARGESAAEVAAWMETAACVLWVRCGSSGCTVGAPTAIAMVTRQAKLQSRRRRQLSRRGRCCWSPALTKPTLANSHAAPMAPPADGGPGAG